MKKHRKNVTIALPEDVAHWVRVEAAKNGTSTSGYICELLIKGMTANSNYEAAWKQWKKCKPYINSSGKPYPTRDELHE